MAKEKLIQLGTVNKIFDSGMVRTNKGFDVFIKAQKGDKLVMDRKRKTSILAPTKAPVNNTPTQTTTPVEITTPTDSNTEEGGVDA